MQPNLEDIVVGGVAKISLAILSDAGLAADPSVLRLLVKSPNSTLTTYVFGVGLVIVKDSVGHYHANIIMTLAGNWSYRWESEAPNAGVDEGRITVKKSIVI